MAPSSRSRSNAVSNGSGRDASTGVLAARSVAPVARSRPGRGPARGPRPDPHPVTPVVQPAGCRRSRARRLVVPGSGASGGRPLRSGGRALGPYVGDLAHRLTQLGEPVVLVLGDQPDAPGE